MSDDQDPNLPPNWFMWLIVILLCVALPLWIVTSDDPPTGGPDACSNATPSGC